MMAIDGYHLIHRARSGFVLGEYAIVYNFFRSLKAIIEEHKPTRVVVALEGYPKHRHDLLPSYKANRSIEVGDPQTNPQLAKKIKEHESFVRQKKIIIKMLKHSFPVSVVVHEDYEADDTIYNIIASSSTSVPWVVISGDSDFIQLLQEFSHVTIYDVIKKSFVKAPEYPYVMWKVLRGDASDNIPGIPGVGDKTAIELLANKEKFAKFASNEENYHIFKRNIELIAFKKWSQEEAMLMMSSQPEKNWDEVIETFDGFDFKSMTKETYWKKFQAVFDELW